MPCITVNVSIDGVDFCPKEQKLPLMTFGPVSEQKLPLGLIRREPMIAVLTDTQQVDLTYGKPVDKKGGQATVQAGSVAWKSTDETVATVTAGTEDPITGTVVAGLPGTCEVWVEADADLGDGVKTISGEKVGIQVTSGEATAFGPLAVGTPVEQP